MLQEWASVTDVAPTPGAQASDAGAWLKLGSRNPHADQLRHMACPSAGWVLTSWSPSLQSLLPDAPDAAPEVSHFHGNL